MSGRRSVTFLILFVLFAFASSLLSCECEGKKERVSQPKTPRIFLVLDKTELGVGETLGVSVKVENVENVYGVAFDLLFDSEAFELASSRAGEFLKLAHQRFLANFQSDDSNRLVVGVSRVGDADGTSGEGVVASFELKAKSAGSYSVALDRVVIKDPELNSISVEVGKPQSVQVK